MGKILKLLILVLLCFNFAYSQDEYMQKIQRFDRVYKSLNSDEMLKYHHDLKGIYIKSIINNDLRLKIKTLERLVITSSSLGLDSKAYEEELKTLQRMAGKKGSGIKKLKLKNDIEQKLGRQIPEQRNEDLNALFSKTDKKTVKKSAKKKVYKNPKKIVGSDARVVDIQHSSKGVSLIFDRKIGDIDVKNFALKGKRKGKRRYMFVYDIGGVLTTGAKRYKVKNVKILVNQYNKKVIRVVFASSSKLKLYYSKIDNVLNIGSKNLRATQEPEPQAVPTIIAPVKRRFNPNAKVIVVDAGHGGKDGGAQGGRGLSEKKIVLQVALRLGKELKARGFKVYFTRTRDKFVKLRSRTRMSNKKMADLFVSIHANAAPNRSKYKSMYGVETFFLSPARSSRSKNVAALENKSDIAEMDYFSKQTFLNFLNREKIVASNKLALDIQQSMLNSIRKKYKVADGGVREAPFWVLVGAQMPAVLVEVGYITHPIEGRRIASKSYQKLLANGIANGIQSYFAKNN